MKRLLFSILAILVVAAGCTGCTPTPVPAVPDLVVSSLSHSPASPITTDTITFTAVVKNVGTGQADASQLSLKVGGETTPPTFSVPALAPGATYEVQRELVLEVGAQNYLVTAKADVNNDVAESNEDNNQRTDTFHVYYPVL